MHNEWEDQLPFYAAGLLSEENAALVEAHLQECESCQEDLAEWHLAAEILRREDVLRDAAPPLLFAPSLSSNGRGTLYGKTVAIQHRENVNKSRWQMFRSFLAAIVLVIIIGSGLLAGNVLQNASHPHSGVRSVALLRVTPTPIPLSVTRENIYYEQQASDDPEAAVLAMALSIVGSQQDHRPPIARWLKPHPQDVNVSPWQMVRYVNDTTNYAALDRMGGTIDLLKQLLAIRVPVIVELGSSQETGDSNYALVTGYDEATQQFLIRDRHQLEASEPVSYTELDEQWRQFNRTFIVVYEDGYQPSLTNVLGDYLTPRHGAEVALQQAQTEADINPADSWAWFNIGTSYTALGDYENAATAYDQAFRLNLPDQVVWHQFGPYEAYYQVGRYRDILALVDNTQAVTDGVEEASYWRGMVYTAQNEAVAGLEAFNDTLDFNPQFFPAREARAALVNEHPMFSPPENNSWGGVPITAENSDHLQHLLPWEPRGLGAIYDIAWKLDSETLVVASGSGIWEHNLRNFSSRPHRFSDFQEAVYHISINADGSLLAGSTTDAVYIWNMNTGEQVEQYDELTQISAVAFSPTDSWLAISGIEPGNEQKKIQILNVATGTIDFTHTLDAGSVTDLEFSHDSNLLAIAGSILSQGNNAAPGQIWNIQTDEVTTLEGQSAFQEHLAFGNGDTVLAYTGGDQGVYLWDVEEGIVLDTLGEGLLGDDIAFAPGSAWLAVADWSVLHIRNLETDEAANLQTGETVAGRVLFSPNGQSLAVVAPNGEVQVWDLETQHQSASFIGYMGLDYYGSISALALAPDGSKVAAASTSGNVTLWSTTFETIAFLPTVNTWNSGTPAFSSDGTMLAYTANSDTLRLWDIARGEVWEDLLFPMSYARALAFESDGTLNATDGLNLWRWHPEQGNSWIIPDTNPTSYVTDTAFSADGTHLVQVYSEGYESGLKLWTVREDTPEILITEDAIDADWTQVVFHPNGQWVAVAKAQVTGQGTVLEIDFWNITTRQLIQTIPLEEMPLLREMIFSPDGSLLALLASDGTLHLLRIDTGEEVTRLQLPQGLISTVAFSPDGTLLVTGDSNGLIWPWVAN
jgi:WD40 repeat protein